MPELVNDGVARELLVRCARRDEQALVALHELMARRIHAFARNRLGDDDAAKSVVVSTLFEVWNSAARFRGESRVSTWVLGIAWRKIGEEWRQRFPGYDNIDDYAESLVGEMDDGAASLDRCQQEKIVHRCMGELSASQRECLQLVYFEEMGISEVAAIQQVPEGTVKTRLFHARRRMRCCIEENGGSPL